MLRGLVLKRIWDLLLYRILAITTEWWTALAVLLALELLWLWIIKKKPFFSKATTSVALLDWIFVIIIATVLSRKVMESYQMDELFSYDISTAWKTGTGIYGPVDTFTELVLNILVFFPIGYLLAKLSEDKRWIVFGGSLLITLTIETLQLVTRKGFFELSDILLNMTGVVAGYAAYRVAVRKDAPKGKK